MNLKESVEKLNEDRPIAEAFANLLLRRFRERFPEDDIRLEDIELHISVRRLNAAAAVHRMVGDMVKESVGF